MYPGRMPDPWFRPGKNSPGDQNELISWQEGQKQNRRRSISVACFDVEKNITWTPAAARVRPDDRRCVPAP